MALETLLRINMILGLMTIGVAILVINTWLPTCIVHPLGRKTFGPHEWLLVGVSISFLMTIGDNLFWGVTWYSKLMKWPTSQWWFDHGPSANLVFRHVGKICAGMCHLEAARQARVIESEDLARRSSVVVVASVILYVLLT